MNNVDLVVGKSLIKRIGPTKCACMKIASHVYLSLDTKLEQTLL